jgi:CrcB protein
MMQTLLWVGVGGAIGSMGRFLCHRVIMQWIPHAFPFGTFAVNIIGCFLIGLIFSWNERGEGLAENTRLFLMTGICGGFTTFSAFTLESMGLLRDNKWGLFVAYVAGSVVLGIAATIVGMKLRA